ncbi:UNVERIFIED_CONTAM: hypothetical protein GTU68_055728 [Idotea baltica]|nr:hypothetical protein [Idotea baltica]
MSLIVTEKCLQCKLEDCIEICPVDCFYSLSTFLIINPLECIDCLLCQSECPINAIYIDNELPQEFRYFNILNVLLINYSYRQISRRGFIGDKNWWVGIRYKQKYFIF